MAVRLRRADVADLVLLEPGANLGGTWRDNSYPGAVCDVSASQAAYDQEVQRKMRPTVGDPAVRSVEL